MRVLRRDGWRWVAAITAVVALVLVVGLVLRVKGLAAAANVVTLCSIVPVIGGLLTRGWARRSSRGQEADLEFELPGMLRDIAKAHDLSRHQLRTALRAWDVDAYLDGAQIPQWEFVSAFLDAIAGGNKTVRQILEDLIKPVWDQARTFPHRRSAETGGVVVLVRAADDVSLWVAVNQQAAAASDAVTQIGASVGQLNSWRAVLIFTLRKYSQAVRSLTRERDKLAGQLVAQEELAQQESTQTSTLRADLRDVRQRLSEAERLQEQTRDRLEKAEHQLRTARQLRDTAIAQATEFRRRLADLEQRQPPPVTRPSEPSADNSYILMGDTDQQIGEEILRRADNFLREQDTALTRHAAIIRRLSAAGRKGLRKRYALPVAVGAGFVASVLLLVVILAPPTRSVPRPMHSSHPPGPSHSPPRSPTAGATAPPPLPRLTTPPSAPYKILQEPATQGLYGVAFSPDGNFLAAADQNGSSYLWKLATDTYTHFYAPGNEYTWGVAFSPDGKTFAAADNHVNAEVWNVRSHKLAGVLSGPSSTSVFGVAFSRDNILAAADSDGHTYLEDEKNHKRLSPLLDPHSSGVRSVAFSPDGKYIATGDANYSAYLWDANTHARLASLLPQGSQPVFSVAFNPASSILASANMNGRTYLWNVVKHWQIAVLPDPHSSGVRGLAFGPDGALATCDLNGYVYIWNVEARKIIATMHDPNSRGIYGVAFSQDYVFATADNNGNTYLWNMTWLGS